jgi:uncharacterized membrane protein
MVLLIAGLIIFLGVHSIRIVAEDWRAERIRRMGERRWKGIYAVISIVGFVVLVWGFGLARHTPVTLWTSPYGMRHVTALLVLPAFILVVAAYVPGTHIRKALGHPMLAGTALWAFAHLLSNGGLADVVLFGAFLVWAAIGFVNARARDRKAAVTYPALGASRDVIAVVVGTIAWAIFGMFLHGPLIGVRPFG